MKNVKQDWEEELEDRIDDLIDAGGVDDGFESAFMVAVDLKAFIRETIKAERQALVEEIRRQVGYKDIFDILDSIYPDPTPSEGGEKETA